MEFFLLFIVVFVAFFLWQYIAYKRDIKIKALENQVKELQEACKQLSEHYHEFVKATVKYLKENAEEE